MEKECINCVYYLAHFIKSRGRFQAIPQGHCINKKPSGHYRKTDSACECFLERDLQKEKEEQLKSAEAWLALIYERLNDLSQILAVTRKNAE